GSLRQVTAPPAAGAQILPDSVIYMAWNPTGESTDTLGTFLRSYTILAIQGSGGEITSITVMRPAFLPYGFAGTVGDRAYVATGEYEVILFGPGSTMELRIRPDVAREQMSEEYLNRSWQAQ